MINKILSGTALVGLISLGTYSVIQDTKQQAQITKFMNVGPRFTAQDGKALCERVKLLETLSYGYKDAGDKPLDCDYEKR